MSKKSFRYIAAICFAAITVLEILQSWQTIYIGFAYGLFLVSFQILLSIAGTALVAISLFASAPVLSSVGFILKSLSCILNVIDAFAALRIYLLGCLVLAILLTIASFCAKAAKPLGFAAAGVGVVALICYIRFGATHGIAWGNYLAPAINCVGAAFYGLCRNTFSMSKKQATKQAVQLPVKAARADDLLRLKALLDSGVITQEEFEAQKKKLLGV